jgi:hypothetical protein
MAKISVSKLILMWLFTQTGLPELLCQEMLVPFKLFGSDNQFIIAHTMQLSLTSQAPITDIAEMSVSPMSE